MTDNRRAMTGVEHQAYREAVTGLEELLATTALDRRNRKEFVEVDGGREVGWVLHERQVMFAETNRLRATRGRTPVTVEQVEWAESRALGHSDYMRKFALGCADLVIAP